MMNYSSMKYNQQHAIGRSSAQPKINIKISIGLSSYKPLWRNCVKSTTAQQVRTTPYSMASCSCQLWESSAKYARLQ